MIEVDISDIFSKLRTKNDISNFFRENSNNKFFLFLFIIIAKYYPKEKSFNKEFLLGVLRGTKKLLPLGCFGGFNLPYYSKSKKLTKEYIFQKFLNDQNLLSYLPDNVNLTGITREFLLSVLFYGNREKYLQLYEEYKNIQIQKSTSGNRKFVAIITEETKELLKQYKPIDL